MDVQAVELASIYSNLAFVILSLAPILVVGCFYEKFMILSSLLLFFGFLAVAGLFSAAGEIKILNCSPSSECLESTGFVFLPILTTIGTFFWAIYRFITDEPDNSHLRRL